MAVVPFHFQITLEAVRYQALTQLATLAGEYAAIKRLDSEKGQKLLIQMTKMRLLLKGLDYEAYLEQDVKDRIMYALIQISGIYEFPTAPILSNVERPAILIGTGGGTVINNNTYTDATAFANSDVDTPSETVDSFGYTSGSGAVWMYTIRNAAGTAQRSGTFTASWLSDGSAIDSSEVSSPSVGLSTDDVVLSATINAGDILLITTVASNNWGISGKRYLIPN